MAMQEETRRRALERVSCIIAIRVSEVYSDSQKDVDRFSEKRGIRVLDNVVSGVSPGSISYSVTVSIY